MPSAVALTDPGSPVDLDPQVMSGLEILEAIRTGRLASPGVAELLQLRMTEVEEGRAVFELETRPELSNPLGSVHGGITATMLDTAMGCAVHSELPAGVSYTTVDLAVTYLRPAPYDGRTLRAEGRVVHVGGRIATATGRVVDDRDRLMATGTTTCMVFRSPR